MQVLQVRVPRAAEKERVKFTAHLVAIASKYASDMYITSERLNVDLKSVMGMMTIVINDGKEFTIEINGIDEQEAKNAIENYFASEKI